MSHRALFLLAGATFVGMDAGAQQLTLDAEVLRVSGVGDAWVQVPFLNTYDQAVPVCTYVLPSPADRSTVVRVRNVDADGLEVRAQIWEPSGSVSPSDVTCLVLEAGVQTLPGGQMVEARRIVSSRTTGLSAGNWNPADFEDASGIFTSNFADLVVLGQVMTANDPEPSTFVTRGDNRRDRPTSSLFRVGKHIGQISGTRATETLAVIATSPGSGTGNGVTFAFGITPNVIQGVGSGKGSGQGRWSAPVAGDFDAGVLTQNGENGGQGGFAVLVGPDPLPDGELVAAIDEETLAGDRSRGHLPEEVAYALFRAAQTVEFEATKTVATREPGALFAPGEELTYTLTLAQTGSAALGEDTLFVVDALPPEVELFTGDLGAPGSGPVAFTDTDSGLAFAPSDVGYVAGGPAPTRFSDCDAVPAAPYDPDITHLCIRPRGRLAPQTLVPGASAGFAFRARLK